MATITLNKNDKHSKKLILIDMDTSALRLGNFDVHPKPEGTIILDLRGLDFEKLVIYERKKKKG